MYVVKRSGEREEFDPDKTRLAIMRSGLPEDEADEVLRRLQGQLYDGITTEEIYRRVRALLMAETKAKYGLKKAIMNLGPEGHHFESFIGQLYRELGFNVKVREMVQGCCVQHELDVLAENGERRYMVECKFHNSLGIKCTIQTALYTYGRFMDIKGPLKLTQPWLVTNTRFSSDVVRYSDCVGLGLMGWRHPEGAGLETIVERYRLYPVTILEVRRSDLRTLLDNGIILVRDVLQRKELVLSLMPRQNGERLITQAESLMGPAE